MSSTGGRRNRPGGATERSPAPLAVEDESDTTDVETRLDGARVLLVEDEPALARSLQRALERAKCLVAAAGCGEDGRRFADEQAFDAAVVDVGLPDQSGFDVVYALRTTAHPCSAVVMTGNTEAAILRTAIGAGVSDFLLKPFSTPVLLASVARAIGHTHVWRLRLASHVDRSAWVDPERRPPGAGAGRPGNTRGGGPGLDLADMVESLVARGSLTAREREALELLLCGYRNDEMAAALRISGNTVKYHVRNILRKLELDTRTDLLRLLVG